MSDEKKQQDDNQDDEKQDQQNGEGKPDGSESSPQPLGDIEGVGKEGGG